MLLQTVTTTGGLVPANPDSSLFIGCPKLTGATFRYTRDEEIYGESEDAKFVYKVVSGAVRQHKLLSDGRRQIGAFHLPGDVFGLESGPEHRLTAEAIVDTVTMIFDLGAVEYFAMRDIEVARELWKLAARDLDHAVNHMLLLGRKTALERVADFLLEMDARMHPSGAMGLPMLRRDIADYLGLTLETVSRTISRLETEGVLELIAARQIKVLSHFWIDEMQNVVTGTRRRSDIDRDMAEASRFEMCTQRQTEGDHSPAVMHPGWSAGRGKSRAEIQGIYSGASGKSRMASGATDA
jgi:CRP/FNR family nitrogen fixation transcriptional regulator